MRWLPTFGHCSRVICLSHEKAYFSIIWQFHADCLLLIFMSLLKPSRSHFGDEMVSGGGSETEGQFAITNYVQALLNIRQCFSCTGICHSFCVQTLFLTIFLTIFLELHIVTFRHFRHIFILIKSTFGIKTVTLGQVFLQEIVIFFWILSHRHW